MRWARCGLTAGSYRVAVQSAGWHAVAATKVALRAGSGPLSLRVGFMEVAGRVRLGAHPLRTRLVFSNEAGGEPVTLTSDDDGRFQGCCRPHPVSWRPLDRRGARGASADQPTAGRRQSAVDGQRGARLGGSGAAGVRRARNRRLRGGRTAERCPGHVRGHPAAEPERSRPPMTRAASNCPSCRRELHRGGRESTHGISERTALEVMEGLESELHLVLAARARRLLRGLRPGPRSGRGGAGLDRAGSAARLCADRRRRADSRRTCRRGAPKSGSRSERGGTPSLARVPVSSEQTITLGASGGRLVLDMQPPGAVPTAPPRPIWCTTAPSKPRARLAGWGGVDPSSAGPTVIEAIEPGVYALCLASPEELAGLWRGPLPSNRCQKGSRSEPGGITDPLAALTDAP